MQLPTIRAHTAKRIARAAAFGGTGATALGASVYGLLAAEAVLARRAIGPVTEEPFDADGSYGAELAGTGPEPHVLAVLGDSSAAGLGVQAPEQTPGVLLAAGLASRSGRAVRLVTAALVGADSGGLADQVDKVLPDWPDVAVILVGANDVTHRMSPKVSVRLLDEAVRRLRQAGCEVVVGTCPDLGTIEPIPHPLRWIARRSSRQLAAAQTVVVVEAGGRTVSLGSLLGPEFEGSVADMFSADGFHPSATGYAAVAGVLLPSVVAALGYVEPAEEEPQLLRGEGVLPVTVAAVEAAEEAGTEVAATRVGGHERGARGRWVALRHRRRLPLPAIGRRRRGVEPAVTQGLPPGVA